MSKGYLSITASFDFKSIRTLTKIIIFVLLLTSIATSVLFFIIHDEIPPLIIIGVIIPLGIYSFVQIMGYSKRDIVMIMQPPGSKRGIKDFMKTIWYHFIDLIIIPTFAIIMVYLYLYLTLDNPLSCVSYLFISLYLIQILPLTIKKESYTRDAHQAIANARDDVKTARVIITSTGIPDFEKEEAIRRHISAEEIISIHSNFLLSSTSIFTILITWIRYSLPIASALSGMIISSILGG